MWNEPRLTRNKMEGYLFLLIVSVLSVNLISPAIMFAEFGFSLDVYKNALQSLPILWVVVVLMFKLITEPLVHRIVSKFTAQTDSFHVQVLAHVVFSVTIMSIMMSVVGPWVGMRQISLEPIREFFLHWPRNFGIAFGVEMLIAQPIARFVMTVMHRAMDGKEGEQEGSIA